MRIVTDTAADIAPETLPGLPIDIVAQSFTLDGKNYRSGVDIDIPGFYKLISATESFPTTAQPAPGEFAEVYRKVAQTDPDILSLHVSEGLSGTLNAARQGAASVPEANVTVFDSGTLGVGLGWQVVTAAQMLRDGKSKEEILAVLNRLKRDSHVIFTLGTLKYLIHGGRISHIRGLLAGLLDIKPMIGVSKTDGKYEQLGRARTLKKAIDSLVDVAKEKYPAEKAMRFQISHGDALDSAKQLEASIKRAYPEARFMPTVQISPVLAAHTGPTLIGMAFGPESAFEGA